MILEHGMHQTPLEGCYKVGVAGLFPRSMEPESNGMGVMVSEFLANFPGN